MESRQPDTNEFGSIDPAPPSELVSIGSLRETLCNEEERMFLRMRALFALRNIGGNEAIDSLAAAFNSASALLKHEIAYVMGQMQDSHAVHHLIERLEDKDEDVMVRHEAAEALGAIGDRTALETLEMFRYDTEIVVAESCEVAIDLLEWISGERFDYSG